MSEEEYFVAVHGDGLVSGLLMTVNENLFFRAHEEWHPLLENEEFDPMEEAEYSVQVSVDWIKIYDDAQTMGVSLIGPSEAK